MSTFPKKSQKPDPETLSDSDFSGNGFEDALFLFWKRNRDKVQLTIVAVLLIAVGALGFKTLQRKRLEKTQQAYLEAIQSGETETFTQKYSNSPLAGLLLLQSADKAFEGEDYTKAISLYQEAATPLKGTIIEGRTQLGTAIATIYAGNEVEGKTLLEKVAANTQLLESDRAEAAYHLAILALNEGNIETARKQIRFVDTLDNAGFWGQKASLLKKATPQLKDA